eukprot:scaffold4529_cov23-Cyclotella_meneghiniana.AAC.1
MSHCKHDEWSFKVHEIRCQHISQHHNPSNFHYKYNKWLEMVEISVWALKWPPQPGFQSLVGSKSKLDLQHKEFIPQNGRE